MLNRIVLLLQICSKLLTMSLKARTPFLLSLFVWSITVAHEPNKRDAARTATRMTTAAATTRLRRAMEDSVIFQRKPSACVLVIVQRVSAAAPRGERPCLGLGSDLSSCLSSLSSSSLLSSSHLGVYATRSHKRAACAPPFTPLTPPRRRRPTAPPPAAQVDGALPSTYGAAVIAAVVAVAVVALSKRRQMSPFTKSLSTMLTRKYVSWISWSTSAAALASS